MCNNEGNKVKCGTKTKIVFYIFGVLCAILTLFQILTILKNIFSHNVEGIYEDIVMCSVPLTFTIVCFKVPHDSKSALAMFFNTGSRFTGEKKKEKYNK